MTRSAGIAHAVYACGGVYVCKHALKAEQPKAWGCGIRTSNLSCRDSAVLSTVWVVRTTSCGERGYLRVLLSICDARDRHARSSSRL